ncbi:peptide ligase PGM1-related protein [soil metagenome]
MLVCPSISFPAVELRKITGIQHYEERLLFMLLALRDPNVRVVYVTSMPVDQAVIDYYLDFLPDPDDARRRLDLVAAEDPEPRALTTKLLDRPTLIEHLRSLAGDPSGAYILPFNVTSWEGALADALGLPLHGARPDLSPLGSKSGARRLARDAGVEVLEGAEDLWSVEEIEAAADALLRARPDVRAVVIKLNNGFSGQGNAIVQRRDLRRPLEDSVTVFCAGEESWPSFRRKIASGGAIVEELVRAPGLTSPSVQMTISSDGAVAVLSTHDQVLGGPDEQVYLGCRFPARADYREAIRESGLRIARALADRGVIGPFGVDFLVVPAAGGCRVYLSEINLRMGGTTHPLAMAQLASGGRYEASTGELLVGDQPKSYVATDNLKSDRYIGMAPSSVVKALRDGGLAFDPETNTGATLHLLGALRHFGKMGVTCIENSTAAADGLLARIVLLLDRLAGTR